MLRADEPCAFEDLGCPGVFAVAFQEIGKIELCPTGLVEDDVYRGDLSSEANGVFNVRRAAIFLMEIR